MAEDKPEWLKTLHRSVEKSTGMSIEEIQRTPLDQLPGWEEAKNKKYPGLISHAEVEHMLDKALRYTEEEDELKKSKR